MIPGTLRQRIAVGALSASAALFVGIASNESYTDAAVIPVKGDVPTYGFGMTTRPDGTPVRMGDRTNPVESLKRTLAHVQQSEGRIKQCVTAPLYQAEYDLMVDFSYQYGEAALCRSGMVREANAGHYAASCQAYKEYRFVGKGADRYDCSTTINGERNRRCWGVWTRSLKRAEDCMAVQ